jgi:hypothetical protein
MPSVGGFGCDTEFEVGAQVVAEAMHCILGSLHRGVLRNRGDFYLENSHISEECGIIVRAMKEYSRPLYPQRLEEGHLMQRFNGNREAVADAMGYAASSVDSIRLAAPRLMARAEGARTRLDPSLPPDVRHLAEACYDGLAALADAMQQAVAQWPRNVSPAFAAPALVAAVTVIRDRVDHFIDANPDPRIDNSEVEDSEEAEDSLTRRW